MGVTGLWELVHPAGRPVTLESLEGKILAVDVSIWLNQLVKGMRDRHGNPLPNAHILGLFRRVCKLLFYRIRPIFVFDGSVPALKKQTLAARRQRKVEAAASATKVNEKVVKTMLRHHALRAVLGQTTNDPSSLQSSSSVTSKEEGPSASQPQPSTSSRPDRSGDMFSMPPLPDERRVTETGPDGENEAFGEVDLLHATYQNLDDVDVDSEEFKSLPPDMRHEILTELKLTRKHHSWAHIKDLPQDSDDFSKYQVAKLMRQSKLSQHIDSIRKELNSQSAGDVATSLVGGQHVGDIEARRVASEDASHYILITGLNKEDHQSSCQKLVESQETVEIPNEPKLSPKTDTTVEQTDHDTKTELTDVQDSQNANEKFVRDLDNHCDFAQSKEKKEIILIDEDVSVDQEEFTSKKENAHKGGISCSDVSCTFPVSNSHNETKPDNKKSGNVENDIKQSSYKSEDISNERGFVRELDSDSEDEVQITGTINNPNTTDNVTVEKSLVRTASPSSILSLSSDSSNDGEPFSSNKAKQTEKDNIVDISADIETHSNTSPPAPSQTINAKDFMKIASRLIENVPLLPQDIDGNSQPTEQAKLLTEIEGKHSKKKKVPTATLR